MSSTTIQVRFTTRQKKYLVPDSAILVPTSLSRYGLSEVINHLLATTTPIPFDFIINSKFLRTSIQDYLTENSLSSENILEIEYFTSSLPPTSSESLDHDDWVSSVHILRTKNEKFGVCSGSYDNKVRIWSKDSKLLGELSGHEAPVKSVKFLSSTEKTVKLVSSSMDESLIVWEFDVKKNAESMIFKCEGHEGAVEHVSVFDELFASSGSDGSIRVWSSKATDDFGTERGGNKKRKVKPEVAVNTAEFVLDAHIGQVSSTVFSSKTQLYSTGWDHSVRMWDLETSTNVATMNSERVGLALDHSNFNGLLASGHADPVIRIWDTRNDLLTHSLKLDAKHSWNSSISWSPTSNFTLCSGGYDGNVRVWDIRSNSTPLIVISGSGQENETGKVFDVDWFDGKLVVGGEMGVKVFEYSN
ncbi:WD repeat-containing protein 12 [Nowakowskiella sp. JEL0407]|nr:WD repeat-containing protein 12 [Nowakowskiella sp. JEL0407]